MNKNSLRRNKSNTNRTLTKTRFSKIPNSLKGFETLPERNQEQVKLRKITLVYCLLAEC